MSEVSRRLTSSPEADCLVPHLDNSRTHDVVQSIVSNRKSWKTLRGGEMVWPPELEAALIEGLENYKPDDSRETRLLGRFPLRNRFISEWIFEKTGKRRTAKQVGSRLQQLRDTCGGKKLINLISPRRPIPARLSSSISPNMMQTVPLVSDHDSESGSDGSCSTPTTPTEPHATLQSLLYRGVAQSEPSPRSIVYIDLLAPGNKSSDLPSLMDEDDWSQRGCEAVQICPHPRSFAEIDPTITFTARSPKSGFSQFELYENGELIHSESSELKCLGPLPGNESFSLHKTCLMPGYWSRLAQVSNLSTYHIAHRVFDNGSSSASKPEQSLLFFTVYKFRYPSSSGSYGTGCYSPISDDLEIGMDKNNALDYSPFSTMLSITPPIDYSSGSRPYDVNSWHGYPSGSFLTQLINVSA